MRWPVFRSRRPVEAAPPPFFFSIPLRPRLAPSAWATTERLLGETLRSVFAQDDPHFGVIIAGHDRPDVPELADPRVTFLQAELDRPTTSRQKQVDKLHKRRIIAAEIGRRGGGYIMFVDSDDLIDHRIVSFVRRDLNPVGYMVRGGYVLDDATGRIGLLPDGKRAQPFSSNCGTCAILRFSPDELPRMKPDRIDYMRDSRFYEKVLVGHRKWETALMLHDRFPGTLPFRGVIYRMNSGDNLSYERRDDALISELLRATVESPVAPEERARWFDGASPPA